MGLVVLVRSCPDFLSFPFPLHLRFGFWLRFGSLQLASLLGAAGQTAQHSRSLDPFLVFCSLFSFVRLFISLEETCSMVFYKAIQNTLSRAQTREYYANTYELVTIRNLY